MSGQRNLASMRGTLIAVIFVFFGFPAMLSGQKTDTLPCPERKALFTLVRIGHDSSVILLRQEFMDSLRPSSDKTKMVLYRVSCIDGSMQKTDVGSRQYESGKEIFVTTSGIYVLTEWKRMDNSAGYAVIKLDRNCKLIYREEFEGHYLAARFSRDTLQVLRFNATKLSGDNVKLYSVAIDYISTDKGKLTTTSTPFWSSLNYNRYELSQSYWYGVQCFSYPNTSIYSGVCLDRISIRSGERSSLFSADEKTTILDVFVRGDTIGFVKAERIIDTTKAPGFGYLGMVSYGNASAEEIQRIDSLQRRFFILQQQTTGYLLSFVTISNAIKTTPAFVATSPYGGFVRGKKKDPVFFLHGFSEIPDSISTRVDPFLLIADPYLSGTTVRPAQTLSFAMDDRNLYCGLVYDDRELLILTTIGENR